MSSRQLAVGEAPSAGRAGYAAHARHLGGARHGAVVRRSAIRSWAAPLQKALADESLPKAVHDYKSASYLSVSRKLGLAGVRHDLLLYAYLLDPTYSTYGLQDLALRKFNLKLAGSAAEAADMTLRLARNSASEVEEAGLRKVYDASICRCAGAGAHGRSRCQA